jgi:hypothetical protein
MPRPKKALRSARLQREQEARRRKILHADQPWLQRIEYVCDQLFASNLGEFARAIELDSTHLGKVFKRQYAVSVQLLAQILSHTNVRADWLLWGNGPMLDAAKEEPGVLTLPTQLHSSFPLFDPLHAALPPRDTMSPYAVELVCPPTDAHVDVAQLIHTARSANQPVLLFIGAAAMNAGAGIAAIELLRKKYVTAVATTGTGLLADIRTSEPATRCDLNYVARMAANQGLGYAEAVGRWAFAPQDNKTRSLLHAAYTLGVPASVHVEIGEMAGHCCPSPRGAEIGAAVGAATYVDLLLFAEQVRQLCATQNGVVLFIGDAMRGLHLFLQTRAALPRETELPTFHAVLIDNHVQPDFASYVNSHNGTQHKLVGTFRSNVITLLNVCDGVFSGQITKTVDSYSGVSG